MNIKTVQPYTDAGEMTRHYIAALYGKTPEEFARALVRELAAEQRQGKEERAC